MLRLDVSKIQDLVTAAFTPALNEKFFLTNIRILHIEETQIDARGLRRLLKNLKQMVDLTELHLINLNTLDESMEVLASSLKKHKKLKVLDIRRDHLRARNFSALVPLLSTNKVITEVDISSAFISRDDMQSLW